ncbi:hypothetical protein D1AOALGA4SA_3924 [Olavius algarvensis Delta 1 endosymbiont]|nr:hypothetical protein D1AOALGA4SA_3924 [Olavius algarvensis Delta 1 endosymbiont]
MPLLYLIPLTVEVTSRLTCLRTNTDFHVKPQNFPGLVH